MKSKTFIIGFFVVVAVFGAVSVYFRLTVDPAEKSITSALSPDGKFKATKVTLSNGGTAPFCFDTIAVRLSVYPDDFQEHQAAYEVYAAACGTPAAAMEWLSSAALRITVGKQPPGAKPARTKDTDISKTVAVTVVKRE